MLQPRIPPRIPRATELGGKSGGKFTSVLRLARAWPRWKRCYMPAIDDSALRTAAQQLLRAARHQMPGVDWAAQVVESERGFLVVEVAVDSGGPMTTTILLDLGGREQKVLAQITGRG